MSDKPSYEEFRLTSYLSDANAGYIDELYEEYLKNPDAVDAEWRNYFKTLNNGYAATLPDVSHKTIRQQFAQMAKQPRSAIILPQETTSKQENVDALIMAFRRFGHLNAKINPLGNENPIDERLTLKGHELSEADFNSNFKTRGLLDKPIATLKEIYSALQQIYCGTIGVEYTRLSNEDEREWLREYVEHRLPNLHPDAEIKRNILKKLIAADGLEKHLETKYPGQKRFSIEGGDALIPLLDDMAQRARVANVKEMVVGMAHRGRLNVLINIMGQSPLELFQEFEGTKDYGLTTGDVKYHRGFSSDVNTKVGPIHLTLAFNPSHLEFINAVVMGSVRARQDRDTSSHKRDYAMAVIIHGDAAFAGQGIVMETLSMSQTRGYAIGGSIHIILNNQVGFTISDPRDARSSLYCSDLAKMIDAPVFHVNGDDTEAVVALGQLALDYRMKFHKDVVIDLVCYRRHGHNEADEPRVTQPMMYKIIDNHAAPREIYAKQLAAEGIIKLEEAEQWFNDYRNQLDEGRTVVDVVHGLSQHYAANWTPHVGQLPNVVADTSVPKEKIIELGKKLEQLPAGFVLQKNVAMVYDARKKMNAEETPIDWGYAEIMAYATLLVEGYSVRLAGEDSRRGTFFHRHAFVFDQNTGEPYMPLEHLNHKTARVEIYDSLLSEAGTMGFEYGYSAADPKTLVIWEAQYGDFANGAQVIIDQFISSGWQKWNRMSGLVLFLPHGSEGAGPEHSSARLERYLQLCAQKNMQVFVPTTPAQMFHLLRRQVLRPYRGPLIVMSPKSLLRNKMSYSTLDDLAKGQLQLLIPEVDNLDPKKVRRVILCCGKIYFELLAQRREHKIDDIALIRIEQLYPFPYEELQKVLNTYANAKTIIWCQEEPKNQGAWFITRDRILKYIKEGQVLDVVSRPPMAAPATGYGVMFKKTQQQVITDALQLKQ